MEEKEKKSGIAMRQKAHFLASASKQQLSNLVFN